MNELSGYVFSSLREGGIPLHRGSGNGLTPILLVSAEETSRGCVERLEHEYALKSELDADWAARPVVLTHDNGRMTLMLEDPGGTQAKSELVRSSRSRGQSLKSSVNWFGGIPCVYRKLKLGRSDDKVRQGSDLR
jgi:hypothetical protein